MPLSGLDIYKLLPKTNCRKCGFPTCLAFAMQLAKKAVSIDKCPFLSDEARKILEASAQPPIKLVTVGQGDNRLEVGNETVLFRHEEKFHHPCGIGFIIDDTIDAGELINRLEKINRLKFERIGQQLSVNLVGVRQKKGKERFTETVKMVLKHTDLGLVLMSEDADALAEALAISKERRPLIHAATPKNAAKMAALAKEYKCPLVACAQNLEELIQLARELGNQGVDELMLDVGKKSIRDNIWDFTQIRRLALKKSNRALGFPIFAVAENDDPYAEAIEAAAYIVKYAGVIMVKGFDPAEALSLLTARQNIYTDPQKPLQIEPKLYAVGQVSIKSPLMVTTNFSLTYYTVLGEVEASRVPSYILSVDTEGMSVLTAWAAEKFTPEKISLALDKCAAKDTVAHKSLIIPGYVAVMSGDLEERSGWKIMVGPKEASGLPSFLKNL